MSVYTTHQLQELQATGRYWEMPAETRMAFYDALNHAPKCDGCGNVKVDGTRYCWFCGADDQDIFGKILATKPEDVQPSGNPRFISTNEEAKLARQFLNDLLGKGHGVRVYKGRGTASAYIHVDLPNLHGWNQPGESDCANRTKEPGTPNACPYCERRSKACRRLNHLLEIYVTGTEDRSDIQTDYFDFTWCIY